MQNMKSNQLGSRVSKLVVFLAIFFTTVVIIIGGFWFGGESKVEPQRLGNPMREDGLKDRALNVWDMQAFDGKIYLGGGSTVTNSGPINVWAYDPKQEDFVKEYRVKEEAIEHYRVLDKQLYIPASDPVKGDRHKFYRREGNKWKMYTDPKIKLAHVRDLVKTDTGDILMVGNGRQIDKPENRGTAIASFTPEGVNFEPAGIENVETNGVIIADFNWFFSVFRYQDRIFATNSILRDAENYPGAIAEYNPRGKEFVLDFDLRNDEFIPDDYISEGGKQGLGVIYRPWHPVEFQDYLVYPARSYSITPDNYQAAYMNSLGLFYKSAMGSSPEILKLPKGEGEDVLVVDDELYILASRKTRNDKFINYVYKTSSLGEKNKWQRVVRFKSWNKARSFEYLDGTFYFGLGQDYGDAVNNSGDILSYRPQSWCGDRTLALKNDRAKSGATALVSFHPCPTRLFKRITSILLLNYAGFAPKRWTIKLGR